MVLFIQLFFVDFRRDSHLSPPPLSSTIFWLDYHSVFACCYHFFDMWHDRFSITSQIKSCYGQYLCLPNMAVTDWLAVPNLWLLAKSLFIGFIPLVKLPSKLIMWILLLIVFCSILSRSFSMRYTMCFCILSENIPVWPFNWCQSDTWVALC